MTTSGRTIWWQYVVHENEHSCFGWKPDPLSNDVHELPNAEVRWHQEPVRTS